MNVEGESGFVNISAMCWSMECSNHGKDNKINVLCVKTLIPYATAIAGPVHAEQCGADQVAFIDTAESVRERRPVPRHESEGSAFINLRWVSNPEPPGLETSVITISPPRRSPPAK